MVALSPSPVYTIGTVGKRNYETVKEETKNGNTGIRNHFGIGSRYVGCGSWQLDLRQNRSVKGSSVRQN